MIRVCLLGRFTPHQEALPQPVNQTTGASPTSLGTTPRSATGSGVSFGASFSQVTLQINERPSSGARAMIPAAKILQRALFR